MAAMQQQGLPRSRRAPLRLLLSLAVWVAVALLPRGADAAAPVLSSSTLNYTCSENTTLQVAADNGLLSNATDADGDTMTVAVGTGPSSGATAVNANSGAFNYTPNGAFSGVDSWTFDVSDGNGGTVQGTAYITVLAANKNPALNATSLNYTTAENTTLTVAAASGLLSIAYDPEGGSLNVTAGTPGNGAVVVNAVTGAFNYSSNPSFSGLDSFTFTVTDVAGGSVQGTVYVQVTAANKNPALNATSLNYTTAENTTLTVAAASGLLSIAYDPEGGSLNVTAGTPSHGAVVVNAVTGAFNYTPAAAYSGLDSFTFTVTDAAGGSVQGTAYVQVTAANKNPRLNATSLNFTTSENATLAVAAASGLLSIAYDPEGGSLNVTAGTPGNGAVVVNAVTGAFNYTPSVAYSGLDSFTFTVTDAAGGSVQGTVYIRVIGANHAPVLNPANRAFTTVENTTLSVAAGQGLLSTATDADGNTLHVNTSAVFSGTVAVNALTGAFNFTPDASFVGLANFTYTVFDGLGGEASGAVTINVTAPPPNNPPVLNPVNRTFTTRENTTLSVAAGQGLLSTATDADGNTLHVNASAPSAGGAVVVNSLTGAFNYTPASAFTGVESFSYVVFDGLGGEAVGYVIVNVTAPPPNQPPVLNPATVNVSTAVNVSLSVSAANGLLRNASDPDGDTLTASAATQPTNGTANVASNGSFVYTPNPGFSGDDSFNFTVSDGRGGTAIGTVYIFVSAVNRPPVLDPSTLNYTTLEDTPLVVPAAAGLLSTATDPDNNRMSVVIDARPGVGNVSRLNATSGAFTYYPAPNFYGEVNFTFNVTDGAGGVAQGIAYVTVVSVPDPPVVASRTRNYTINENATLVVNASQGLLVGVTDPEGGPLNVTATTPDPSGTLELNSTDGSFSFAPDPNFVGRVTFNYTITSEASGASVVGMSFIRVLNVPHAPVLNPDTLNYTGTQGVRLTVPAAQGLLSTASDLDNDTLTVSIAAAPKHGTVSGLVARTGAFRYAPAAYFAGDDAFSFTVRDPSGRTANGTAYIRVAGVPYVAPGRPVNLFYSAGRNVAKDFPAPGVLVNVLHGENATLNATLVAQPFGGNVTLNPEDGSFNFTSAPTGPRVVFFRVRVFDPAGAFLVRVVTITLGSPALAAPTVNAFQLSCAVSGAAQRCRWALLTESIAAGTLDVVSGDPPGAPNGMEVLFVGPSGRTCSGVRLPGAIAAGANLELADFGCPRCGRCIARLGVAFGQPVAVRVRARASRGYLASPYSTPDFNVTYAAPSAAAVAAARREMAKGGSNDG